jgi:hypothetical protein
MIQSAEELDAAFGNESGPMRCRPAQPADRASPSWLGTEYRPFPFAASMKAD